MAKILRTNKKQALTALAAVEVGLFGITLMICGTLWSESLCKDKCPFTPNHRCELSSPCPSETPCLCLSVATHWIHGICAEMGTVCAKWGTLTTALIYLVFLATGPLFFLFGYMLMFIIFVLSSFCVKLGSSLPVAHSSPEGHISKLQKQSKVSLAELSIV